MPFIIFTAITAVFALYIFARCIFPFPYPLAFKVISFILLILLALCSQSMAIARYITGTETLPFILTRVSSIIFVSILMFTLILLLRDIILFLLFLVRKATNGEVSILSTMLSGQKSVFVLCFLSFCTVLGGLYPALKVPDIKEITITIPNLPEGLKGVKVVQLTDLHIGSAFNHVWLEKVVEKTNTLNADVIVITGDIIDASVAELAKEVVSLKDLKAKYGTYLSLGNHEYYSSLLEWIKYFKEDLQVPLLVNEHEILEINNEQLAIVGLADSGHSLATPLLPPDNKKAREGLPEDITTILLSHQPKEAKNNSTFNYDLQLAGHTHGGHVFFLFPLVARANDGYLSGLYQVGNMQLYVSNGTGLWGGFPLRIGAPSEITLITLN